MLAGVKSVTLVDDTPASFFDLSSQFYVRESEVGQLRGALSTPRLAELNPYTVVRQVGADSLANDAFFHDFQAVVLSGALPSQELRINAICHAAGIPFVALQARGFTGSLFVDFGDSFEINDRNGEEPIEIMISDISNTNPGVVKTLTGRRHGLDDGDSSVKFSEIQGMTELNTEAAHRVKVIDPYSFSIGDTSSFSKYQSGGLATEVKVPAPMSFVDLATSLKEPEISYMDFGKMDNAIQTHIGLQAVSKFREENSRLPSPWSHADANRVFELAQEFGNILTTPVRYSSVSRSPPTSQCFQPDTSE